MSRYIDFDFSTKGLAINLPNGTIKSDAEGCLVCDMIVTADISNNAITQDKLDYNVATHFVDISDNNTSNTFYPTFVSAINPTQYNQLYVDSRSGPLTYTPSNGALNCLNMRSANMNDLGLYNLLRTNIQYTTIPINLTTGTVTLTKGIMFLQAVYLFNSISISRTGVYFTNSGSNSVAQMALYNKNGLLLGSSQQLTTNSITPNSLQLFTWPTPPTTTTIDMYYLAILCLTTSSNNMIIQSASSIPLLNIGITAPSAGKLGYVAQTSGSSLSSFPSQLTAIPTAITTPLFITIN
jgi:hypothetical protein